MSKWYSRSMAWFGLGGLTVQKGVQIGLPMTTSGPTAAPVNFDTAMAVSSFWSCVKLLAETVAALPLECWVLTTNEDGSTTRKPDTKNRLWRTLNYQPNRYQTRVEFFETMMLNLVVWGNAYAVIQRDVSGDVIGLLPIMAGQVSVDLDEDGSLVYTVYTANGDVKVYSDGSIWHVKLFGNGLIGLSPLSYAAQSLGVSIATERRISTMAKNGGKATGVLMVDKLLTPVQRERVRANFRELEEGNNDGLFVLEAGMSYEQTSLSPQDMQLLETRKFQVEDVARFLGVPSVLINDTSGTTAWGTGIAQIMEGFYKLGLRPYLQRLQVSAKRHLIPMDQWDTIELEFCFEALLRMDELTRYKTYQAGINSAVLKPSEARSREGLPSAPHSDKLYANGTLTALGEKPAKPAPTGMGQGPVPGVDGGDNENGFAD